MFYRLLKLSKSNSFFLFGARGTGKSTLMRQFFSSQNIMWIDLLEPELELTLLREPSQLREQWNKVKSEWIVIDEVQKLPKLLDVVHSMIENEKVKFALTGSSARKLKRGQANLLAGRAFSFNLYPLCAEEIGEEFDLSFALHNGTLPAVFKFQEQSDRNRFLISYANTYIKEEVLMEQIVRSIEPFRKFLPVAAQSHGRPLNFSKIAREAGIDPKSVERYFTILEDTLLGSFIDSYHKSVRKRQLAAPKFYFFDVGIQRALAEMTDVKVAPRTSYFGEMFEAFIVSEILRLKDYTEKQYRLSYLQTQDGLEVDLVIEAAARVQFLIEIKSSNNVDETDLSALRRLKTDFPEARRICLCQETRARTTDDGVEILPWREGVLALFR